MSAYPNIPDPMLALSSAARRELGRCVSIIGDGPDAFGWKPFPESPALLKLQTKQLVTMAPDGSGELTAKGWAMWEGRSK